MLINHASRHVTAKIVYYGAGLSGKTTNLQYIFSVTNPRSRGELVSMETEIERTIFFDLLPMNVGTIRGYQTKFQLYTVPGQVFYDSTRKLVLRGADGIVFVVDSQELMCQANLESFENLRENIGFYGGKLEDLPLVFQYNKRDLKNIMPLEQMNEDLNSLCRPYTEAIAKTGMGVIETLRQISNHTLVKIRETLEQVESVPSKGLVAFDIQTTPSELEVTPLRKIAVESPPASMAPVTMFTELADKESKKEPRVRQPEPAKPPQPEVKVEAERISVREAVRTAPPSGAQPEARVEADRKSVPEAVRPAPPSGAQSSAPIIPDDGVVRHRQRIFHQDSSIHVEVRGPDGRVITSFSLPTPKQSRKVDIVLDLER